MRAKPNVTAADARNGVMADAFDEAFDFVRAVIEEPEVLTRLPEKASLALRSIDVQGHPIQLAAARSVEPEEAAWTAHIARWSITTTSPIFLRPILDERGFLHDQPESFSPWLHPGRVSSADRCRQCPLETSPDGCLAL